MTIVTERRRTEVKKRLWRKLSRTFVNIFLLVSYGLFLLTFCFLYSFGIIVCIKSILNGFKTIMINFSILLNVQSTVSMVLYLYRAFNFVVGFDIIVLFIGGLAEFHDNVILECLYSSILVLLIFSCLDLLSILPKKYLYFIVGCFTYFFTCLGGLMYTFGTPDVMRRRIFIAAYETKAIKRVLLLNNIFQNIKNIQTFT